MTRSPRPLPEHLRGRPFVASREFAPSERDRVRRRDVVRVAYGVHASASLPADLTLRLRGLDLVLGPEQFFSHTTAAFLWRAPLPRRLQAPDAPVHVTTIGAGPVMRREGVVGHRVRADRSAVVHFAGFRMSAPAAAWYECRHVLSARELVIVGDFLVGAATLGVSEDDLAAVCRPGEAGVVLARHAAERVRHGAESAMETTLRLVIVDGGFPEPELNVDVFDAEGCFLGRADMTWSELRIVVEYDGDHHRTDRDTFHHDRRRGNGFAVNGWTVLHVTSVDLHDPRPFLERLRAAFDAAR